MSKRQYAKMDSHNRNMFRKGSYGSQMKILSLTTTPTDKQKSFYNKLYAMCKVNELETENHGGTRQSYAVAIDVMLKRLQDAGICKKKEQNTCGGAVEC